MAEAKELSPERQEQRARNVLLHQLARSAKSAEQLRQILAKREVDSEIVERVINRFIEVGLIDDLLFAETLVSARRKFRGRSATVIRRELLQKGISKEICEQVLGSVTQEDELELACELATRKISQMAKLEPDVRRRRLAGFLARKGFASNIVSTALRQAEASFSSQP
jgi:regulatory protein